MRGRIAAVGASEAGRRGLISRARSARRPRCRYQGLDRVLHRPIVGGLQPRWRRDGRELFYVGLDGKLMAVTVKTEGRFEHSAPTRLFDLQLSDAGDAFDYTVDGDGQRFLVRTPAKGAKSTPVTVMTNWLALASK